MPKPAHIIALCVIALLSLGVIMVNSASMGVGTKRIRADKATPEETKLALPAKNPGPDQAAQYVEIPPRPVTFTELALSSNARYMGLAILAMSVGALTPVRRFARRFAAGTPVDPSAVGSRGIGLLITGVVALSAVLLLVEIPGLGRKKGGSSRWLEVGGVSVQPSEFAKWGLIAVLAWYISRRLSVMNRLAKGMLPALLAVLVVAGVVGKEDLGTAILITLTAFLMLLAGGANLLWFAGSFLVAIAGGVALVFAQPYRLKRIETFFDPYQDPQNKGYHMIQSMWAVSSGELSGRGLGYGLQKFDYLPEDTNDFLFAIICEELGLAGAFLVVSLFAALVWTGVGVVRREREPLLKLFALGVTATVGLQALINLFVVTGMGPTKGIALPLVSAGGTGWTLTAFSLGLLISIARTQDVSESDELPALAPIPQ